MSADKTQALLKVIDKIPMFRDVGADSGRLILQLCEFKAVEAGNVVCRFGEQSSEMCILLSGELGVYNEEHVQLATIDPAAPVGEMGLITGQPRSATVRALSDANLLVIKKTAFDRLMRSNGEICARVYGNVIEAMALRLQESRRRRRAADDECAARVEQLRHLQGEIESMQGAR